MPLRAALLLSACVMTAAPSVAQKPVSLRVDAVAINTYRWRGIPRAAWPNAQLETALRFGGARTALSLGVWSNVELGTHRRGKLSDLPAGHWGPSEYDLWAELAHSFGAGDIAGGFIWYQYRGRAGELGTGEVFGRFRGSGQNRLSLSPELSVWYDPVHRKAGYVEAGATVPVLALPYRGVGLLAYLGASAGLSIGHPRRIPELAATNFQRPGFTAADLSAGFRTQLGRSLGGLRLDLAGHLEVAADSAVRRKRLNPAAVSRPVHFYLTLGAGFRWPVPRDR